MDRDLMMSMTLRERLLTVLRGGAADRIPWNVYGWLLPDTEASQVLHQRGLSLMEYKHLFRAIHEAVSITEDQKEIDGQPHYRVRIETPVGTLTEEATREPNYGSRWIRKYFITGPEDYPAAEFFFRHTRFEPDFEAWRQADLALGDGGIVVGGIRPIPIMYLMVAWMGVEGLSEGIYLYGEQFEHLLDALNQNHERLLQLAAESPAEVIWFDDNVTATIISPKLFERYCAPIYARAMPLMRSASKIPIAHYDGSIRPLLHHLAKTDLPVIEAFTPPPMGDLTVVEAKAAWLDKVVWVNFPGCLFVEPAETIEAYILELLRQAAPGGRLVIGCTEDFPADQFEKTFTAIGRALAKYEGYEW
jgi:hypothetical protein